MSFEIIQPAFVDPRAEIADGVVVGPFSVIGPHVRIGAGTRLENNVTLVGHTTVGRENHLYPGVVVGAEPQDISYRGSDTRVVIGDRNILRESVTVNRATEKEEGVTTIGDDNFLMAGCHVAHDCRVGNRVLMANAVLLGGHVHVHDHAALSGGAIVHHYTTIGRFSFTAGLSRVLHDVPPFMLCEGMPARARTVNVVALRRNQFPAATITALNEAYRMLFRQQTTPQDVRRVLALKESLGPEVEHLLEFMEASRGGKHGRGHDRRNAA